MDGPIADELKEIRHYHQDAIQRDHLPKVKDYRVELAGKAPLGACLLSGVRILAINSCCITLPSRGIVT